MVVAPFGDSTNLTSQAIRLHAGLPEAHVELRVIFRRFLIDLRTASGKGVKHGDRGSIGHGLHGSG